MGEGGLLRGHRRPGRREVGQLRLLLRRMRKLNQKKTARMRKKRNPKKKPRRKQKKMAKKMERKKKSKKRRRMKPKPKRSLVTKKKQKKTEVEPICYKLFKSVLSSYLMYCH